MVAQYRGDTRQGRCAGVAGAEVLATEVNSGSKGSFQLSARYSF